MIDRNTALTLLAAQNPEPGLLAHSLQTEAVMAALATHLGQDVALWSLTGLLHDLDYPRTKEAPACHGLLAREFLVGALPEEALRAIAAHNDECTGVPPETPLNSPCARPSPSPASSAPTPWSGPRACPA